MPKLISQTEVVLQWSDITNRKPRKLPKPPKRSTGVHLSGVIQYCLGLEKDKDPDQMPMCMAVGMAWEDWAIGLWPDIKWQPGEISRDRIYGSPDGFSEKPPQVEEYKCTWKSMFTHGDILKQTAWIWQVSGYCYMTGFRSARLHVFWVNGDYRPPSPKYMTYTLGFTDEELEKFWNSVIIRNKDCVKREVWE